MRTERYSLMMASLALASSGLLIQAALVALDDLRPSEKDVELRPSQAEAVAATSPAAKHTQARQAARRLRQLEKQAAKRSA